MHGKFPAIQQNQRNSILFHETIPLMHELLNLHCTRKAFTGTCVAIRVFNETVSLWIRNYTFF
jgi:hypothetical protein